MKDREQEIGVDSINKLLDAVDTYIPEPKRDLDKPFYLPIEQVFSIAGEFSGVQANLVDTNEGWIIVWQCTLSVMSHFILIFPVGPRH